MRVFHFPGDPPTGDPPPTQAQLKALVDAAAAGSAEAKAELKKLASEFAGLAGRIEKLEKAAAPATPSTSDDPKPSKTPFWWRGA